MTKLASPMQRCLFDRIKEDHQRTVARQLHAAAFERVPLKELLGGDFSQLVPLFVIEHSSSFGITTVQQGGEGNYVAQEAADLRKQTSWQLLIQFFSDLNGNEPGGPGDFRDLEVVEVEPGDEGTRPVLQKFVRYHAMHKHRLTDRKSV